MPKNDCQPNIAFLVYNLANFFLSSSGRHPAISFGRPQKNLRILPAVKRIHKKRKVPPFSSYPFMAWFAAFPIPWDAHHWMAASASPVFVFRAARAAGLHADFLSIAGFFFSPPLLFTNFRCEEAALPRRLSPHILSYSPRAYSFTLSNRRFVSSNSSKCRGALARYLRSSSAMPKNSGRLK